MRQPLTLVKVDRVNLGQPIKSILWAAPWEGVEGEPAIGLCSMGTLNTMFYATYKICWSRLTSNYIPIWVVKILLLYIEWNKLEAGKTLDSLRSIHYSEARL